MTAIEPATPHLAQGGVWSAPGRVNLIGEHTDYNGGLVLPLAIDRRTTCTVTPREDRILRVTSTAGDGEAIELSIDELAADAVSGWSAYVLGVAWALGEMGSDLSSVTGLNIELDSDVPIGAGLSSSAAIECSVAVALNDLWSLGRSPMELARAGRLAENSAVGAPTGIMDQAASMLGEQDHAVFLDCMTEEAQTVPLHLEENALALLIVDTRVEHAHATGGYASRRASCEKGAAAMGVKFLSELSVDDLPELQKRVDDETFRRCRHIVTENQRVLDTVEALRTKGPLAIGNLLCAGHASMRDDFEISVPEMDLAVDTAMASGAIGARLTGGGFGGSMVALVRDGDVDAISAAVAAAFAGAGYTEPHSFTVHAASGARRDDSESTTT
ncbi:galactokinase [Demequina aurantiaca]|uniref:galactokinase n=1 Tax=Demequina aurantiaca TaxID=676200 RepID=UPI0007817819|nr:galactokinase [Demequina aurantiaca]